MLSSFLSTGLVLLETQTSTHPASLAAGLKADLEANQKRDGMNAPPTARGDGPSHASNWFLGRFQGDGAGLTNLMAMAQVQQ
jgi:hypothetical protein